MPPEIATVLKKPVWYALPHRQSAGPEQMAMDEALLQWVQQQTGQTEILIIRTYAWETPTLSFGVHQSEKSMAEAYTHHASGGDHLPVVRRPTGGRAILHGEDVSFAFVTNSPGILRLSLADSYCLLMTWVRRALEALGVPLDHTCDVAGTDYLRSSLCFETRTPSDLVDTRGRKVAGSAQLRRQKGLLQHGAAFIADYGITGAQLQAALSQVITDDLGQAAKPWPDDEAFQTIWEPLRKRYAAEADTILTRLSITSGSHLLPASD